MLAQSRLVGDLRESFSQKLRQTEMTSANRQMAMQQIKPFNINVQDYVLLFQKFEDNFKKEFPNDWKTILGEESLKFITQIDISSYYLSNIKQIDSIIKLIKEGKIKNINDTKNIPQFANIKCLSKLNISDLSLEDCLCQLKKEKQKQANLCVIWSGIYSVLIIAEELVKLYTLCSDLTDTQFLASTSRNDLEHIFKKDFAQIKHKFDKLQNDTIKVMELSLGNEDKKVAIHFIRKSTTELREDIRKMRIKLAKIVINNEDGTKSIGQYQKELNLRTYTNLSHTCISAVQMASIASEASMPSLILKGFLTLGHLVTSVVNYRQTITCKNTIERLMQLSADIEVAESNLDNLVESINTAEKIAEEHFKEQFPDKLKFLIIDS